MSLTSREFSSLKCKSTIAWKSDTLSSYFPLSNRAVSVTVPSCGRHDSCRLRCCVAYHVVKASMELCSSGVNLKFQPSFNCGYLTVSTNTNDKHQKTHAGQADSVRTLAVRLLGSLYSSGFFDRAVWYARTSLAISWFRHKSPFSLRFGELKILHHDISRSELFSHFCLVSYRAHLMICLAHLVAA
jgi:hypothetical protein